MIKDFEWWRDNLLPKESTKSKIAEDFAEKYNIPKTPSLNVAKLVSKFGDSTLFFIFYYQQGTSAQILAAEELTKRR